MRGHRNPRRELEAPPGGARELESALQRHHALAHADQSESPGRNLRRGTGPVVDDGYVDPVVTRTAFSRTVALQTDGYVAGGGVLCDVRQCLLNEAVERDRDALGQRR